MSFSDISIAVRAENRASSAFKSLALDVANLGAYFGLLSNEQVKFVSVAFTAIRVVQSLSVVLKSDAIVRNLHAAASWVATTAQNALNISYGTFLALTGVGIAVIVAAAAAMIYFANSMNQATQSVNSFNQTSANTPTRARSIQRAGELDLSARGVE
jgi:uncharacterized membrane protein YcjF (UPF0283 family)